MSPRDYTDIVSVGKQEASLAGWLARTQPVALRSIVFRTATKTQRFAFTYEHIPDASIHTKWKIAAHRLGLRIAIFFFFRLHCIA
jgi:hypothetical protein